MPHKFRDKIKKNFVELVRNIEPETLVNFLVEKKAFDVSDKKAILTDHKDYKHKNRLLLFRILKKNDPVLNHFIDGLELSGLQHLFTTNPSTNNDKSTKKFKDSRYEEYDEQLAKISDLNLDNSIETPDLCERNLDKNSANSANIRKPVVVRVTRSKAFPNIDCDRAYDTKSARRGQVLIINNKKFLEHKPRNGSDHDVQAIKQLFKQMFMRVEFHEDLLVDDIRRTVENFAAFDDRKISDICVVVIMSHGEERNKELVVVDKNNYGLETSWIEEQFNNVNCPLFSGKPKIFLYQFCRGTQMDYATTKLTESNEQQFISNTETETKLDENDVEYDSGMKFSTERRLEDVLVGYATQKGHRAHRDPKWGSWYIQLICEVFMKQAHKSHIVEMLNEVDRRLKMFASADYTMQTSSYTSNGFNKDLYFNPGIYLGDDGTVQNF